MKDDGQQPAPGTPGGLQDQVEKKAERRRRARAQGRHGVWFGLGMFGLVGWAVAIPTLLGILLGVWLDRHFATGRISWTLSLLFVGIILGCLNAWRWIGRERRPENEVDHTMENREK